MKAAPTRPHAFVRLGAGLLSAVLLGACGAAPRQPLPTTRCHASRESHLGEPTDADWVRLLTRGEETRHDPCASELALSPRHLTACGETEEGPSLGRIEPRVVAHQREGEGPYLVWVAVESDDAGMVAGPMAVILQTPLGLEVQALGWLRGPSARAQLRLHALAEGNVVAAMLHVGDEERAFLLAQSGGALTPAGIVDATGCAPAELVLHATFTREGSSRGWALRTVRSAVLRVEQGALVVEEHTQRAESPEADASAPARSIETARRRRTLHLRGARLSDQ